MKPEILVKIGMIASHHFKIEPCEIFLSGQPDFAQPYRITKEVGPDAVEYETDVIALSPFRDGDLRWSMGYSPKLDILALHLPGEQTVY